MMEGVFEGLLIVDLMCVLVGLFCMMLLVDYGVCVIKVEWLLIGDDVCVYGLWYGGKFVYFVLFNCGKESIVFDLKDLFDCCVFDVLFEKVDVVIENFWFGMMVCIGYDWDMLYVCFLCLIYGSVLGFGYIGLFCDYCVYDMIV